MRNQFCRTIRICHFNLNKQKGLTDETNEIFTVFGKQVLMQRLLNNDLFYIKRLDMFGDATKRN